MLTWEEFEKSAPEMARFGSQKLSEGMMYIGTVRKDGYPRLHPFSPFVASGHLFAFMEPTSPKGHDIRRSGLYTAHSQVKDSQGTGGEFSITGKARPVEDASTRELAVKGCPYNPADRYVLFEFFIERCLTTHYVDGKPQFVRWKESTSKS